MALNFQVLGQPGRDNALYVEVNTGQAVYRLLFDCGEACLRDLSVAQIQQIDALLFSHFHIDHVAGFDSFLRSNYDRADRPVRIFGPPGAAEVIHHRLRGATWNLVQGSPGEFLITEIHPVRLVTFRFLTSEAFAIAHAVGETPFTDSVVDEQDYRIEARLMDHGVPCAAYCVRVKPRSNISTDALAQLGLAPGPWLKAIKEPSVAPDAEAQAGGVSYRVEQLRQRLLTTTPGQSIAYLTDFRLDGPAEDRLVEMLAGCQTIVCENNFRNQDRELAQRWFHMISADVGRLASRVKPQKLVLFHLSDRYTTAEWQEQLAEVRMVFPAACFPESWHLDG